MDKGLNFSLIELHWRDWPEEFRRYTHLSWQCLSLARVFFSCNINFVPYATNPPPRIGTLNAMANRGDLPDCRHILSFRQSVRCLFLKTKAVNAWQLTEYLIRLAGEKIRDLCLSVGCPTRTDMFMHPFNGQVDHSSNDSHLLSNVRSYVSNVAVSWLWTLTFDLWPGWQHHLYCFHWDICYTAFFWMENPHTCTLISVHFDLIIILSDILIILIFLCNG